MSKTAEAVRPKVREPVAQGIAAQPEREAIRKPANPHLMEWVDPTTGKVWTRSKLGGSDNVLDFPTELIPEGYTYCWVRKSVYNQEDRANIVSRGRNGWSPVPADRHPDRVVEYEGLVLMEAPTVFVEASRAEERARASQERKTSLPGVNLPKGYDQIGEGQRTQKGQVTFARVGSPVPSDPTQRPSYRIDIDS